MTRLSAAILFFIVTLFPANPAFADMYKWVDQNGVVHFSDTLPASGQEAETIKTPDYPPPEPSAAEEEDQTNAEPDIEQTTPKKVTKKKKKSYANSVEIFTTSW